MSVVGQRSGGTRAARLLARVLVVAGTVAGVSAGWLAANEANAQTPEPAADRSVVETGTELVSDVLAPTAPLVSREPPLPPVVDSLTGALRATGSTVDSLGRTHAEPIDEERSVPNAPSDVSPQRTIKTPETAPPPEPVEPRPEPADHAAAPAVPRAPIAADGPSFTPATTVDQDEPDQPTPPRRGSTHPAPPAPTTGGSTADNGHGSHSGVGVHWHDFPRWPDAARLGEVWHSGTFRLIGVAGPQPGTTPD